jgi:hypothetical protein
MFEVDLLKSASPIEADDACDAAQSKSALNFRKLSPSSLSTPLSVSPGCPFRVISALGSCKLACLLGARSKLGATRQSVSYAKPGTPSVEAMDLKVPDLESSQTDRPGHRYREGLSHRS